MHKIVLMSQKSEMDQIAMHNAGSWIDFHQSLIQRRLDSGMTQSDVAKTIGVSQSAVAQFESLSRRPNLDTVFTYALAVGAKLDFGLSSE